jgi:hypothetical protein
MRTIVPTSSLLICTFSIGLILVGTGCDTDRRQSVSTVPPRAATSRVPPPSVLSREEVDYRNGVIFGRAFCANALSRFGARGREALEHDLETNGLPSEPDKSAAWHAGMRAGVREQLAK